MNYELRITNYELRITNYELRITNYELRITNYPPNPRARGFGGVIFLIVQGLTLKKATLTSIRLSLTALKSG